jgi:hypothetical protein
MVTAASVRSAAIRGRNLRCDRRSGREPMRLSELDTNVVVSDFV